MADEPEKLTIRLLQEMRAEMRDGFEKTAAETGRIHADLKGDMAALRLDLSRVDAGMARMHAEVLATKSPVLDVVVKLTALERRASALEEAPVS